MIDLGCFDINEVLPFVTDKLSIKEYVGSDGKVYRVKMNSLRYRTFAKSLKCKCCGLQGTTFLLQRHIDSPEDSAHFNLYSLDGNELVLMTKDHRLPKSKGGRDIISNLRTMCTSCNRMRQSSAISLEKLRKIRQCCGHNVAMGIKLVKKVVEQ